MAFDELGNDFVILIGINREKNHVAGVAAAFAARGLPGVHVDSRQVLLTDSAYTKAVPQFEETNERLQKKLKPLLDDGQVPVMGGFIGSNRAGITTTIGRGGSDFSAAIVGAALEVEDIQIWTDVDGIMTTDPRMVRSGSWEE